jgi:hypothetical protein
MLHPIDQSELASLSLPFLVQRMDQILIAAELERYGAIREGFPVPVVSDVLNTSRVLSLPDDARRIVAHIAFSYLVQMDLTRVSGGIGNRVLYTPQFNKETSWVSPLFQLRHDALRQYDIVSSRMAMEILMDLLYFIDVGCRLEAKRSKLKKFRQWLCDPANPFHYFAHVLLEAYAFDRQLRTPEVHHCTVVGSR